MGLVQIHTIRAGTQAFFRKTSLRRGAAEGAAAEALDTGNATIG